MIFLKRSKKSGVNKMKKVRNKKKTIAYIIIILVALLCDFLYAILYLKGIISPEFNYIPECILLLSVSAICAVKFKDKGNAK